MHDEHDSENEDSRIPSIKTRHEKSYGMLSSTLAMHFIEMSRMFWIGYKCLSAAVRILRTLSHQTLCR
jgi:hypothetical protein